jgi:arsenate reductase
MSARSVVVEPISDPACPTNDACWVGLPVGEKRRSAGLASVSDAGKGMDMVKRLAAEFLGTAMLLFVVVGTGLMVAPVADDTMTETITSVGSALQLFIVGVSVAVGLAVIIILFVTISGAHFNPVVTMVNMIDRSMDVGTGFAYMAAQFLGAAFGVIVANVTFDLDPITISQTDRIGPAIRTSEAIATFLLVLVILALVRTGRGAAIPWAVGGIVLVIVLATPSTGFANPALTLARTLTDTYTGIAPTSVLPFIGAEIIGGLVALALATWLFPKTDHA